MEGRQDFGRGGKRVVVVGGGVAGSLIAKSLQFEADVTLIDSKEYFEITWAALRSMVEPSFAERSVIRHKDYLTNGRLIVSSAIDITDSDVLTEEGRQISYDYLVIATGHNDHFPKMRDERLKQYQEDNDKIRSAQSILIIGGGPTGVELAGEIAVDFPEKKVTLIHSGYRLLQFIGPKASRKALDWLTSKRVEVKLEQSINVNNSDGSRIYVTSAGEKIQADCHFLCIGKPVGSDWLKETILEDNLDERGMLQVDANLRVKGRKNIFAIGDITDIREMKQGYIAQKHARIVARNLKLLINGGDESKMAVHKPGSALALVSLGRQDAVAQLPWITVIGLLPGFIKSRDLFVGRTRKQMGLEP